MKIKVTTKNQNNWVEFDYSGGSEELDHAVESLKSFAVQSVETISGMIVARA